MITLLEIYLNKKKDNYTGVAIYRTETGRRFQFSFFMGNEMINDPDFPFLGYLNQKAEKKLKEMIARKEDL